VFAGFCFPPDVIVLAVRWYLRFGLSYRNVEELLAERGIRVDHVTVYRWVQRFTLLLADAARPCRHAVGDRWHVDETYVKVAGQWRYVYRAVDQFGQVIDVFMSRQRDARAARRFFERAMGATMVTPTEVVTDRAATYSIVMDDLLPAPWHRTEQYAWGAETRSCNSLVLVEETTQPVMSANAAWRTVAGDRRVCDGIRRSQPERPVRAMGVVVLGVDAQDPLQMPSPGDQEPVQTLGADCANHRSA
jgi:transposase-like protein